MSEDPKHPWGTGATTHNWTPAISTTVQSVLTRWPGVTANSYVCHPWCGWSRYSVDFWGRGGRGDPIGHDTAMEIWHFLFNLNRGPSIRHAIHRHWLWTDWGGYSTWTRDDHSGRLQHLHVTYWR